MRRIAATCKVRTGRVARHVLNGFSLMVEKADDHFHMVFNDDNKNYLDLPGLTVLLGGMWIVNLNYWGCNQYITQRALGADLPTARNGILFAAFLKLLMPVIVVLPGIAAFVLYKEGMFQQEMIMGNELNPDRAYPVLLNLLPVGLKGLAFAALTAAIVASLAGKANSISTIFTLDIYKRFFNTGASEKQLVYIGRVAIFVSMILAMAISPFMGIDKKGGFQYIQEYTGFVSPGIFAIFILGFFWKRTTATAALVGAVITFPLSLLFKFLPKWTDLQFLGDYGFSVLNPESALFEIPFLDRMGFVFLIVVVLMVVISLADKNSKNNPKGLEIDAAMFKPKGGFAIGAALVCGILAALYIVFW
jgi:SSS family solute:Na+ symporter